MDDQPEDDGPFDLFALADSNPSIAAFFFEKSVDEDGAGFVQIRIEFGPRRDDDQS